MKLSTTIKTLLLATTVLYTGAASADTERSDKSKIASMGNYASGTVYFTLENVGATSKFCEGYFFEVPARLLGAAVVAEVQKVQISASKQAAAKAQTSYDVNVSSVLAAFHSGANVEAIGETDEQWAGTQAESCRLTGFVVTK